MRIALLGNAGSGKSTLARRLIGERNDVARLSLDEVAWREGTAERVPLAESLARLDAFTARHDAWIVEGCYGGLVEAALPHCDELRFLNPGAEVCVAHCRARPWEPEKFASPAEQQEMLETLVDWVRAYETRDDECGLARHREIFDAFGGRKREYRRVADYDQPPPEPGWLRRRIAATEARLTDARALGRTLEHLVAEGSLAERDAAALRERLPGQLAGARYVLRHLAAHLAIGVIFAFDVVPLPLGTIARVAWVAGNRAAETLRGARARARVHSLGVLLVAAIPWFGYAAYLLPLRRRHADLAFALANHTWLERSGRSYEAFLADARAPVRRLGRWLVPHAAARGARPEAAAELG